MSQSKIVAWNASSAPETSPRPSVDRQTDKTIAPWRATIAANASPSRADGESFQELTIREARQGPLGEQMTDFVQSRCHGCAIPRRSAPQ